MAKQQMVVNEEPLVEAIREASVEVKNVSRETLKKPEKEPVSKEPVLRPLFISKADKPEEVVAFDKSGHPLVFDHMSLLELSDGILDQLSRENKRAYFVAENTRKEMDKERKRHEQIPQLAILDPLGNNAERKLKLRKRPGYHQAWKRPDELEECLDMGYRQIRKAQKETEKPGYETGTVIRLGPEDKPELLALEIPEPVFRQHLLAMSFKSRAQYEANKGNFRQLAEKYGLAVQDDEEELEKGNVPVGYRD